MSPRCTSRNRYTSLLTSTRSPEQPGQPCRVFSIELDGMKNACTRNVLMTMASTIAAASRIGSSFQKERFLAGAFAGASGSSGSSPASPGSADPAGGTGSVAAADAVDALGWAGAAGSVSPIGLAGPEESAGSAAVLSAAG